MKKTFLASALLALAFGAIAQTPSATNERAEHWLQTLKRELPLGSSRDTILEWASTNKLVVRERPPGNDISIRLESMSVLPPGARAAGSANAADCLSYQILATMTLDATKRLLTTRVETATNCF